MSVVVLGMEMPMDCDSCCVPGNVCDLWIEQGVGNRHPDCPIRQLPEKHGRLGDLDAIMNKLAENKREVFTKHDVWLMLSRYGAETIVEAEGD